MTRYTARSPSLDNPSSSRISQRPFWVQFDLKDATLDFLGAARQFRIWYLLAMQDLRQRYRRSVLGPFWITLSAVVSIVALGLVYSNIFHISPKDYLVFLTTGFVVWLFLSTLLVESCNVFIAAEGMIRQINLPLGIHVMRMVWRNALTLLHNLVAVGLVLLYMRVNPGWNVLFAIPALLLTLATAVSLGYLLGGICTRFRDIPPIVASFAQVLFYVTPVIWPPRLLKDHQALLTYNPFFHFLELLRAPLSGERAPVESWWVAVAVSFALFIVTLVFLSRYRWRIAYWV